MTGAEFEKAQAVLREFPGQYSWARCIKGNEPATHFVQEGKDEFSLFCDEHAPDYAESLNLKSTAIISGNRPMPIHPPELIEAFLPENLMDTVSKLSGPGMAELRSKLTKQFGIRLQSTGDDADVAQTVVVMQTIGASPKKPYLVNFEQIIIDPFTGPGQFDLVERDARRQVFDGASAGGTPVLTSATMNFQPLDADTTIRVGINPGRFYKILSRQSSSQVTLDRNITLPSSGLTLTMDGATESEVTIATKAGFADVDATVDWTRPPKSLTSDKVYSVVFVPGTAGDGVYSIRVQGLGGGK